MNETVQAAVTRQRVASIRGRAAAVALALALSLTGVAGVAGVAGAEGEADAGAGAEVAGAVAEIAFAAPAEAQGGAPAAPPAAPERVTMLDNRNVPYRLKVAPGTTVTWINRGALPHTVSAQSGAFESGMVQPGQSYSFTFDAPGEYAYFCRPHVFVGMLGTVVVE